MAEIDWTRFAAAVRLGLEARNLSLGQAVDNWPATNKAMWHRACNAKTLLPGSMLLVCGCLDLDPFAYLTPVKRPRVTRKDIVKQIVTRAVQRETSCASRAAPRPADAGPEPVLGLAKGKTRGAGRDMGPDGRSPLPPAAVVPGEAGGRDCGPPDFSGAPAQASGEAACGRERNERASARTE